ncbi:MAG: hypothetical protein ACLUD0_05885 [Eubacterium ramulus]
MLFICDSQRRCIRSASVLDHVELIEVSSYTENEKMHIAKNICWKNERKTVCRRAAYDY